MTNFSDDRDPLAHPYYTDARQNQYEANLLERTKKEVLAAYRAGADLSWAWGRLREAGMYEAEIAETLV